MKFLVTGGAGFIGSHLVKYLLECGHSVRVFDNLHAGHMERLSGVTNSIDFIKADIRNKDQLEHAMSGCDGVFHEAALVAVQESYTIQQEYHDVNVMGTENVFDLANRHNIRVVYASSSSVYGNPQSVPIYENATLSPENPYGITKLNAELKAQKYMTHDGAEIIGLRYFNVYGMGQTGTYAGVITQFMRRLKAGLPPIINGTGSQTRDFVHVTDVIKANLAAMTSTTNHGFFNIGTGRDISIKDLAYLMAQIYSKEVAPTYTDPLYGDIAASKASTSLATNHIPWRYSIELEEGLSGLVSSTA